MWTSRKDFSIMWVLSLHCKRVKPLYAGDVRGFLIWSPVFFWGGWSKKKKICSRDFLGRLLVNAFTRLKGGGFRVLPASCNKTVTQL